MTGLDDKTQEAISAGSVTGKEMRERLARGGPRSPSPCVDCPAGASHAYRLRRTSGTTGSYIDVDALRGYRVTWGQPVPHLQTERRSN